MSKSRYHANLMEKLVRICLVFLWCLELVSSDRHLCLDEPHNATRFTKVCDSILITSKEGLKQLCGCTLVDGSLQIRKLDDNNETLGEASFPELREVREFILIWRVPGPIKLMKLFPNLFIVRGESLIMQHAIVVHDVDPLDNFSFPSLRYILRGSILINEEKWIPKVENCGVNHTLLTEKHRLIDFQKRPERDKKYECSTNKSGDFGLKCPANLGQCCHSECLSGCRSPNDPKQCFACRNVLQDHECRQSCSSDRFQFHHLCVTYQHCLNKRLLIVNQTKECLEGSFCPSGYKNLDGSHCVPCGKGEMCPQICPEMEIRTLNQAADLKGCEIVDGSLTITIELEGLTSELLESYMSQLREVNGYVRILKNHVTSLNFLKGLKTIRGRKLYQKDQKSYAFVVEDNPELESIFTSNSSTFDHSLSIERGDVYFWYNSRLCPNEIWSFVDTCVGPNITRLSQQDIIGAEKVSVDESKMIVDSNQEMIQMHITSTNTTNGSYGPCRIFPLNISVEPSPEERGSVIISHDILNNSLFAGNVSFLVFYKKVKRESYQLYEQFSSTCFQEWSTIEHVFNESNSRENKDISISGLESDSRYMFHIIANPESRNGNVIKAESGRVNASTPFYNPSPPVNVEGKSNSPFSLDVSWDSPDNPNGKIDHYIVQITRINITQPNDHRNINFSSNLAQSKFELLRGLMRTQSGSFANQEKHRSFEKCRESEKTSGSLDNEGTVSRRPFCTCDPDKKTSCNQLEKTAFISNLLNSRRSNHVKPSEMPHVKQLSEKDSEQRRLVYGTRNTSFKGLKHPGLYKIRVRACQTDFPCVNFNSSSLDNSTPENWNQYDHGKRNGHLCKLCSLHSEAGVAVVKGSASRDFKMWIRNNTKESESGVEVFWSARPHSSAVSPFFGYYVEIKREETQMILTSSFVGHTPGATNQSAVFKDLPTGRYLSQVSAINMKEMLKMSTGWVSFYYLDRKNSREISMTKILKAVIIVEILLAVVSYIIWRRYKMTRSSFPKQRMDLPQLPAKFDDLLLTEDQIEINEDKLLGTGQFGKVFEAVLKRGDGAKVKVAVKVPNRESKYSDNLRIMAEADLMQSVSTNHVVKLIGILPDKSQFMIVMELMGNRDLRTFLKENQKKHRANNPLLNSRILIKMACEAADGMAYLSSKLNLVHKDIAARNCLVSDSLTLKIADLGIAGPPDPFGNQEVLKREMPIRWMAPESLKDRIFTTKTDVWSYGILLWEISTAGETPYETIGHEQVAHNVVANGSSLAIAPSTILPYTNVMESCWNYEPTSRPSFSEIFNYLIQFLEREDKIALLAISSCYNLQKMNVVSVSCQNETNVNARPFKGEDSGCVGQCSNQLTGSNAQTQMGREQGSLNRIYCNVNAPENSAQWPPSNDGCEATPTLSVDALSHSCQINSFQLDEMPASKPIDFRLQQTCFPNECSIICPDRGVLSTASSSGEASRNPCINNNEPKTETAVNLSCGKRPKSIVERLTEKHFTANVSPFRSRAPCELTPFKAISKLKDSYNCSNSRSRYLRSDYSCEAESSAALISPMESPVISEVPFFYCQCPAESDKLCSHPVSSSVFAMSCAGGQNLRCDYGLVENKNFGLHLQSHYKNQDPDTDTLRSLLLDEYTNVEV